MRLFVLATVSAALASAPQTISYEVDGHAFQLWADQDRLYHKPCDAAEDCDIRAYD